jgi:AcrR family transcriptional regulator
MLTERPEESMTSPPDPVVRQRGTLRAEQKASTRRKLIDSGMRIFSEKGYVNTTIDDIVLAAGTTRTSFYLHFKNKSEIPKAAIREVTRDTAFAGLTCDGHPPSLEEVQTWIDSVLSYWRSVRDRESVFAKALEVEPELASIRAEEIKHYMEILKSILLQTGRPPGARVEVEAMLLFCQINRFFDLWNERGGELDQDVVAEVMAELIWKQLSIVPIGKKRGSTRSKSSSAVLP